METFPWLYPYEEDGPRRGTTVLRPVVRVTFAGQDLSTPVLALIDSGCDHVLAAPWLANDVGLDDSAVHDEMNLGIGGRVVRVRFVDMQLRLHPHGAGDEDFVEWTCEVGLLKEWRPTFPAILGQRGFFDQFTVTMNRLAQTVAIEDRDIFDTRFSVAA